MRPQSPLVPPLRQKYRFVQQGQANALPAADVAPLTPYRLGPLSRHFSRQWQVRNQATIDELRGLSIGVGNLSPALSVQKNLAAANVGVGVGAAVLGLRHNLAGAIIGVGVSASTLGDQHRLAGAVVGVGASAAALRTAAARAVADTDIAEIQLGQPEIPPGGFDRYLHVERLRTEGRIRAARQAEMEPLALMLLAADAISEEEWALLVAA